ncbi:hypothetical protein KIN20_004569 [Parelaphostrongylus tenuis]|uniref:Uncharacterized protein n=1 Tax=Parelaphostrongylus tenuis TaxID=148309 RepID=A0AAD5M1X4_PARTN|nr:hypothetical protein KIN20_004569 [Parelaphostrongylus tenuis]
MSLVVSNQYDKILMSTSQVDYLLISTITKGGHFASIVHSRSSSLLMFAFISFESNIRSRSSLD